jgi:hypothetical protein
MDRGRLGSVLGVHAVRLIDSSLRARFGMHDANLQVSPELPAIPAAFGTVRQRHLHVTPVPGKYMPLV